MDNNKKYRTVSAEEAAEILHNTNGAAIVMAFSTDWTGNGQMMDNFYEELAKEYYNDVYFLRIDSEDYPDYASSFRVRQVPTTILFKNKVIADRFEGLISKSEIEERLERILTKSKFF